MSALFFQVEKFFGNTIYIERYDTTDAVSGKATKPKTYSSNKVPLCTHAEDGKLEAVLLECNWVGAWRVVS